MQLSEQATLERPAAAHAAPRFDSAPAQDAPLKLWFDGELVDADRLQAALNTHALHYGSGVFEGIRAYATRKGTAVFRLPEHLGGAGGDGGPVRPRAAARLRL